MLVNVRRFRNIPIWFKEYVEKPFGCYVLEHFVEVSNKFMEENRIIYVDAIEFSKESYSAIPGMGFSEEKCPCFDMRVTRYLRKDSEKHYG